MDSNLSAYTGVSSDFRYVYLPNDVGHDELKKYCSKLRQAYAKDHTKKW